MRPVCGCAVENIGSRRTLERAGFLTRHRLLELVWD
jgi:RimJ/RimL family protein N-acetyltransferase